MPKKIYIRTFGCQMNSHDSERVKDLLLKYRYSLINNPKEADILLFNTCSVRKHAEERLFGNVSSLKVLKKRRPDIIFGILGCMAEAHKDLLFRRLPHVDFVCGPASLDKIPEIINRIKCGAGHLIYIEGYKSKILPKFSNNRLAKDKAYVKIMEGCDNFCSYCIVPYVRGKERSRPLKEILNEIKRLLNKKVKKITLLGQNVNSYGKGFKKRVGFLELLKKIDKIAARKAKIDFITSHPKDAGSDLFKVMADLTTVSKTLHLPLQSGSSKILKKMNRGYTVEKYKRIVNDFRKFIKNSTISTDLIVGFPGETKKDFQDTLKIVKEIKFDAAYIFKYSPRPFTKASKFKDDVPKTEKEKRHAILLKTQKEISLRKKKCR